MEHITKGKWVIIVTRDKDNWPAYSLQSMNNPTNSIEVEANRQLIESAPEIAEQRDNLLTACEEAAKRRHDSTCQGNCLGGKCDCWLKEVNEAIAKATQ